MSFSTTDTRTMQCIPPELLDLIVDWTQATGSRFPKKSLTHLRLVCKNWYPSATSALFRTITLDNYRAREITAILARSPLLADLVRHIVITCKHEPPGYMPHLLLLRHERVSTPWYQNVLPWLSDRIVRAQTLRLVEFDDCHWEGAVVQQIHPPAMYASIEQLTLLKCSFSSGAQMAAVLGSFPALRHLVMPTAWIERKPTYYFWDTDLVDSSAEVETEGRIPLLSLDMCACPAVVEWALRHVDFTGLTSLTMTVLKATYYAPCTLLPPLIREASALQNLRLDLSQWRSQKRHREGEQFPVILTSVSLIYIRVERCRRRNRSLPPPEFTIPPSRPRRGR